VIKKKKKKKKKIRKKKKTFHERNKMRRVGGKGRNFNENFIFFFIPKPGGQQSFAENIFRLKKKKKILPCFADSQFHKEIYWKFPDFFIFPEFF
jgi:hypothetical protein